MITNATRARPSRFAWRRLAASGLALLLPACAESPAQPDRLVLISVDTLRADRLGAYGSDLDLTPHLDALAAESTVFMAAYAAAPFTLPSMAAMMAGRSPEEIGIYHNETVLPETVPTLASILQARGWQTRAVVSNFVLRRASGIDRGFDSFDDEFPQLEAVRRLPERTASDTTDAALEQLGRCASVPDQPCFLWIHYQDPHGPYTPPRDLLERELARSHAFPDADRLLPVADDQIGMGAIPDYQALDEHRDVGFYLASYHAEIRYLDREIGRFLEELQRQGLAERTLLAIAADHGESLGENDYWFAHGEFLGEDQVRVPLIVRAPGQPHAVRSDVVALTDLPTTLLAALREDPTEPPLPGRNLFAPDAASAASQPYLSTLSGATRIRFALVEDDYKLVITMRDGIGDGRLTRRGQDDVDFSAAAPQIARSMRARLKKIRARMAKGPPEIRQELSDEEREELRALGYVRESDAP